MDHEAPILVIENDDDTRTLLADTLRGDGHRVLAAPNGEEGWAAAQIEPPSLLITDTALPGMDGWEVVRRFHADEVLRDIPIMVVSMVAPDGDQPQPVDGYLVGPIEVAEVREMVATLAPRVRG